MVQRLLPPASSGASPRPIAAGVLALVATGCISETPAGTFFGSDPPGALVYIDGREAGYVTPCNVQLDAGDDYDVRLELPGYQTATFELESARRVSAVPWWNAASKNSGMVSPVFNSWYDFLAPFRTNRAHSPNRIFVRLQPEGE